MWILGLKGLKTNILLSNFIEIVTKKVLLTINLLTFLKNETLLLCPQLIQRSHVPNSIISQGKCLISQTQLIWTL